MKSTILRGKMSFRLHWERKPLEKEVIIVCDPPEKGLINLLRSRNFIWRCNEESLEHLS